MGHQLDLIGIMVLEEIHKRLEFSQMVISFLNKESDL